MSGRVTVPPSSRAEARRVESVRYAVPGWGTGDLWMCSGVVLAHELRYASPEAHPPMGAQAPPTGTLTSIQSRVGNGSAPTSGQGALGGAPAAATDLIERFRAFLAGEPVGFDDIPVDLSWATPFQRALTDSLRAIPRGEVVTYGELAALAGRPGAARAAGTFCATNRFALIVPCHRVVAAGGIGGYGPDGVPIKRRLLALEGVFL